MRWVSLYFLGFDILLAGSIAMLWTAAYRGWNWRSVPARPSGAAPIDGRSIAASSR